MDDIENTNYNGEFRIKQPKWMVNFVIVLAVFSVIGILLFVGLTIFVNTTFWIGIVVSFSLLLLFILGIYSGVKEEFIFKDGEFIYIGLIKVRRCRLSDVKKVLATFLPNGAARVKISFLDINGKKLLSFYDVGHVFKNGKFEKCLFYYNIPLIFNR